MKMYLLSSILFSFALASSAAFAQYEDEGFGGAAGETASFEQLDVDGNGYISRQEAAALPCLSENYDNVERSSEEGLDRREFDSAVRDHC